jgi:membrane protein
VITILFAVIFKVLPDAKIKWKDVKNGHFYAYLCWAVFWFIYIDVSGTGSYGPAGSLIIILVWVYYTAAILYFELNSRRHEYIGARIEPADYAVYVEQFERKDRSAS